MDQSPNLYEEPLLIHPSLAYNPRIGADELITWALMVKLQRRGQEATNAEIAKIRGVRPRQVQRHKKKLVQFGGCEEVRDDHGRVIKYVPVDPVMSTHRKIRKFLETFSRYFVKPPTFQLMSMMDRGAEKLYFILSGLEWQYRRSHKKELKNAWAVLDQCFYGKFNPPKGYTNPDWWIETLIEKRKETVKRKKEREDLEATIKERERIDKWYHGLSDAEKEDRRQFAIEVMRNNGGVPQFGAEPQIRYKMFELYEKERAKHPSLFGKGKR